ncbi:Lin0512 family protein [Jannaschia sp. W003]|uniref:Lin0512 family protein n=1 Tax=Jannaschia sp. W003 TaxID=2867012 RepID=UPI00288300D6|nr:Lin0512 family protein [Jannaschia sp. W003]
MERDAMRVLVEIGVPEPGAVDATAVAALLPYGEARVEVRRGGLAVPRPGGGVPTVIANAALSVALEGV